MVHNAPWSLWSTDPQWGDIFLQPPAINSLVREYVGGDALTSMYHIPKQDGH